MTTRDQFRGMMLGIAAGDSLGAPVEMKSTRRIRKLHGGPLRDLVPSRSRDAGWTTDDTALSICMAESLLAGNGYSAQEAFEYYLHWFYLDGHGMGSNTKFVFARAREGVDPRTAAELFSYLRPGRAVSNGGLMRTAPLGAWYHQDAALLEEYSLADARLTHYGELSAQSCLAYNRMIAALLNDEELPLEHDDATVQASLQASRSMARDLVTRGRGMVLVSLAAAAWAVREADSLEEGLIEVVNWGGDADSNAAIAGGLLGAKFGIDSIPDRWLDTLVERDYFIDVADRLYEQHTALPVSFSANSL